MATYDEFVKNLNSPELQKTIKDLESKGHTSEIETRINQFQQEFESAADRAEKIFLLKQELELKLFKLNQKQASSANQVSVNR